MPFSKIDLFIRSLIFSIFSIATIMLVSCIVVLCIIFPLNWRHAFIRYYLVVYTHVLKWICRIDYKVEGLENIPAGQVGIVMSKHQSTWETFFLPQIFHAPAVIAKRELLFIPFFGWAISVCKPICINRNAKSSAMNQLMTEGKIALDAGRWVMVYPEGTRTAYGEVGHYKSGGARLAAATGAYILPIAHNAGRFWPRRKFLKLPGTITVVIGPPIESKGRTPEEITALTKDWIETTMTRL